MEIQITNLVKKYHNAEVLNINQLQIKKGEIIGLLGNNGAGKTTLLRLMLDLVRADNGYVIYNNMDIVAKTDKWKEYVGAFLDNDFLIDFLYPEEYLTFVGKLHSLSKNDIFQKLEYFESFFNDSAMYPITNIITTIKSDDNILPYKALFSTIVSLLVFTMINPFVLFCTIIKIVQKCNLSNGFSWDSKDNA